MPAGGSSSSATAAGAGAGAGAAAGATGSPSRCRLALCRSVSAARRAADDCRAVRVPHPTTPQLTPTTNTGARHRGRPLPVPAQGRGEGAPRPRRGAPSWSPRGAGGAHGGEIPGRFCVALSAVHQNLSPLIPLSTHIHTHSIAMQSLASGGQTLLVLDAMDASLKGQVCTCASWPTIGDDCSDKVD